MRRKEREITDIQEIESIIKSCDVCRVAFADDNVPYIVTMNFGYSVKLRKIYFHCAREGRKIEMIRRNNYVCFEMDAGHDLIAGDHPCDFSMKFISIVGYGRIYIIDDDEEKRIGLTCIMSHYSENGEYKFKTSSFDKTFVLRLDIEQLTGKKT
jgi:nitroimidazol reductase NimA-like FMN-containing flavoprotein (pyridoxamine 5'-phosphate oxidase superfamily)